VPSASQWLSLIEGGFVKKIDPRALTAMAESDDE
jgi:hypothetical protein